MRFDYMAYAAQLARVQFQSAANILDVHSGLLIAEMELAVVRAELRAGTYAPIQERLERE